MRVGQGFDLHPRVAGRKLIIGGVEIPHHKGLQGPSEAGVLVHAICNALPGAAGLGDIGQHYPDNSEVLAGVDSRELLRDVARKLQAMDLRVVNVDSTIIAQAPRMSPYKARMIGNIAADLGVAPAAINIKATTTEQLGFLGRGEGIAAQAIALLE